MTVSEPLPPAVAELSDALTAWLEERRYAIPLEWDAGQSLFFVGNRRGKTWTRITLDDLSAEGGRERGLAFATRVVDDWRRLWGDRAVFERLPRVNRSDLESYFGQTG